VLLLVGLSFPLLAASSAVDEDHFARLYSLLHPQEPASVAEGDLLERELAEHTERTRQAEISAYRSHLTSQDVIELATYLESPAAARHPLEKRQLFVWARIQKRTLESMEQRHALALQDVSTATARIEELRQKTDALRVEIEARDEKIKALNASLKVAAEQPKDGKSP
jgi:hypothetical protein